MISAGALKATTEEYRAEILAPVGSPRLGVPEDLAVRKAFAQTAKQATISRAISDYWTKW